VCNNSPAEWTNPRIDGAKARYSYLTAAAFFINFSHFTLHFQTRVFRSLFPHFTLHCRREFFGLFFPTLLYFTLPDASFSVSHLLPKWIITVNEKQNWVAPLLKKETLTKARHLPLHLFLHANFLLFRTSNLKVVLVQ
jgi:hypothetical protein